MPISLGRVLEAARERRATLTPEVAGYVILLAAQQLAVECCRVSAQSVLLDETGDVLVERASGASELETEAVLRGLLGALIAVCRLPPPAIVAVSERAPSGDLRGLVAELSAALIPINHSAAHRAIARLHRETRRADGRATDAALASIAERSAEPAASPVPVVPVALPLAEPAELDIDVVVEPEATAVSEAAPLPEPPTLVREEAPEPLPRDLLAPELPTRAPGLPQGAAYEPVISRASEESPASHDDELPLELPAAARRWAEARSDLEPLLRAFLAETRSVEPMLRTLREMIGLELRPHRDEPVDGASSAAVPR
jgi:hypothetical protein